jgi:hypothetical protein
LPLDARLRPDPPTTSLAHDNGTRSLSVKSRIDCQLLVCLNRREKIDVKNSFVFSSWSCQSTCVQIQNRDQRDTHIGIVNSTTNTPVSLQDSTKSRYLRPVLRTQAHPYKICSRLLAVDLASMTITPTPTLSITIRQPFVQ